MRLFKKNVNKKISKVFRLKKSRGYALMVAIILMPILFLIAGTGLAKALIDLHFTKHDLGMKQAFFITEGGQAIASHMLAACNYGSFTHDNNGYPISSDKRLPIPTSLGVPITVDNDGWYVWSWNPGDSHQSITGSNNPESFRFKAYDPDGLGNKWVVDIRGTYNTKFIRRIEIRGVTDTAFKFALFGNQDLSEFVRGRDQTITGKVHTNGELYFRPSGTTLRIISDAVTASGNMVFGLDAWGRTWVSGSHVYIQNGGTQTAPTYSEMTFGSSDSRWLDSSQGALAKWNGRVIDGTLGAKRYDPPPIESIDEGGYYEQNASIVIDSSTPDDAGGAIVTKSLYNPTTKTTETIKEIDISKLSSWSGYKQISGGGVLLYSKTSIRIVNAEVLPAKMSIVSNGNIYTKGDVNKVFGTESSRNSYVNAVVDADENGQNPASVNIKNYSTKKPLALISSQRLWHLSKKFVDPTTSSSKKNANEPAAYSFNSSTIYSTSSSSYNSRFNNLSSSAQSLIKAAEEKSNLLELNSALVDGPPTVTEINYVDSWAGETVPASIKSQGTCWANNDTFLEYWGSSRTVKKRGSIVHMQNTRMANFDNSNAGPGYCPWMFKTFYSPPYRDYQYDPDLADQTAQPPGFIVISRRLTWKVIN